MKLKKINEFKFGEGAKVSASERKEWIEAVVRDIEAGEPFSIVATGDSLVFAVYHKVDKECVVYEVSGVYVEHLYKKKKKK